MLIENVKPTANAGQNVASTCEVEYNLEGNEMAGYNGLWAIESGESTVAFATDKSIANNKVVGLGYGVTKLSWTLTSTKRPDCSDTKTISINSERVATAEVDATKTAATTCDGTVTLYAKELPTTLSTISGYWTVQSNAQDVIGWTGKSSFVASVDKLAQDNNVFFWHLNGK